MYEIIIDGTPWADSRGQQSFTLEELKIVAPQAEEADEDARIRKL